MHRTQVKRHVDSLYSKSDSEKSYKVIEFSTTEKKSRKDHYSSDSSHKDFLQEELQEVWDIIKEIDNQVTEKMSEPGQEYLAELWKAVYTDVLNTLKVLLELVNYREEILQIWQQIMLLATEAQAAAFFKEVYKECYRIFKGQVAQSDSLFVKKVQ